MPAITLTEKFQFVQAWKESGLTQAEFCSSYTNISPRTLRSWIRQTRRPDDAAVHVRRVVVGLAEELRALLACLDAAEGDVDGDAGHEAEGEAAASCLSAEDADALNGHEPVEQPPPPEPARRMAMPPSYTWVG